LQFVFSDETTENLTVLQGFESVKTKAINRNVVRGTETVLTELIFADIESAGLIGNVAADLAQSGAAVLRKDADSGGRFASEETAALNCEAAISNEHSSVQANLRKAKAVAIRKASQGPLELERLNATGGATILTVLLETLKDQAPAFMSCEQAVGALGFKLEPVANH
jgi:hypothetical protein